MSHVLEPLNPPFGLEVAELLALYPKNADGSLLALFRLFANSPRFLGGRGALNLLDKASPLSLTEREIVILRVCANRQCEYEWGVHIAIFAKAAELSEAQQQATANGGALANCWSEREQVLIRCVDQLCAHSKIDASRLMPFQRYWTVEQQLEIFALCGNYTMISMVANTSGLSPEPFAARFAHANQQAESQRAGIVRKVV